MAVPKNAYARIQHQKTITLKELVNHIVEHGSPFSSGFPSTLCAFPSPPKGGRGGGRRRSFPLHMVQKLFYYKSKKYPRQSYCRG